MNRTILGTVNRKKVYCFFFAKKQKGGLIEEEKRVIKESQHKQLVMDIGRTKYTVNLPFKQGTGETYKDKKLKLIKRETDKIR